MAQEGFWVEESLGSRHSIKKPDTHPFLILKVVTVTLSLLGEQVERRDSELLHDTLGQINLLPSVWMCSFSRVLHELLWGVYYAQLGKKIFVGIFGLMEHILSLVSLGLFIFRVWFGLKEGERNGDHCLVFWVVWLCGGFGFVFSPSL